MRAYTRPDSERPIEEIRAEVRRDYEALAEMLQLPQELGFEAAVAAVKVGMVPPDAYPFKAFQQEFAEAVARHSANDDAFADAFEVVTGVWNHFPHDDLGMSPMERMREESAAGRGLSPDDIKRMLSDEGAVDRTWEAVDVRLAFLSDAAKTYLEQHLRLIGGTKKDAQAIVTILADPERDPNDALTYLLIDMMKARRAKKVRRKVTIEDIQPTVRAITMCENHTATVMDNGHLHSRMFQEIAHQCMAHMEDMLAQSKKSKKAAGSIRVIEPIVVLDQLLDVHAQISDIARRTRMAIGLEEAAHHILDWLVLTDIQEILGRGPKEIAALVCAVARFIAATGDPKHAFASLAPKLRALTTGFSDDVAYHAEVARLAEKVICNCGDPLQMMPIPGEEPDDCMERLATIAPCLKLRSPVSLDDLPIPSPFM